MASGSGVRGDRGLVTVIDESPTDRAVRPRIQTRRSGLICVARRRCNIILAMLKTQPPYQPHQPEKLPDAA